jgi:hypothetical protein
MAITTGTPHLGTPFMTYYLVGELWSGLLFYWLPIDFLVSQLWNPAASELTWVGFWQMLINISAGFFPTPITELVIPIADFNLHKYTDAGRDLGSHLNPFMNHICSEPVLESARKVYFKTIVSTFDLPDWIDATVWGLAITQATIYGFQQRWVEAALKLISAYVFTDWGNNSDLAVHKYSQNAHGLGISDEIIRGHANHGEEPKDFLRIIQAVESSPSIDSTYLVEIDTLKFLRDFYTTGKIDTIVADPQNCGIHFKLNNVYFLYQTGVSINLNGMPLGSLTYPEYKGYNDRWCKIPPRYLMYLGGGMNKSSFKTSKYFENYEKKA